MKSSTLGWLLAGLMVGGVGCAGGTESPEGGDDDDEATGEFTSSGGGGESTGSGFGGNASTGIGGSSGVGPGSTSSTSSGGQDVPSGGGTGFASPMDMFNYVNSTRQQYADHTPYDGLPWQGTNADTMTWAITFQWDDALAQEAANEAMAIANGAQPSGVQQGYANAFGAPGESMWLDGLSTPTYQVTALSDGKLMGPPSAPNEPFKWHDTANGSYRLAVAYQTGSGGFNHKTKLGVGWAETVDQETWWVLIFGE